MMLGFTNAQKLFWWMCFVVQVTYHGPGQLVMYPILNLRHQQMDLHWYLRSLEEVVIRALWSACEIRANRIEGLTGVWVGDEKVFTVFCQLNAKHYFIDSVM